MVKVLATPPALLQMPEMAAQKPGGLRQQGQMRQLVLLRHAKAVTADDEDDDFGRALAPEGREAAPRVAAALAKAGAAPEIVLVSDSKRTRETWELAKPSFASAEVRFLRSLYHAPAETLMQEAERADDTAVMLVGHNPGLHDLASRLAHRNNALDIKLRSKFPTAAGAIFTRKDKTSSWKLQDFVTPKDL
jgi:phosphohistidine phosphatase